MVAASASTNGGWVQTMVGAISAIVITGGSMYTVIISPMQVRIDRLEAGREKDRDQLAQLYTSIQTNDQYKLVVGKELEWLRSDIAKVQAEADASAELHKERAGQGAEIADLKARAARLDDGAPTILDEVKTLRTEVDSLRQRIMTSSIAVPH